MLIFLGVSVSRRRCALLHDGGLGQSLAVGGAAQCMACMGGNVDASSGMDIFTTWQKQTGDVEAGASSTRHAASERVWLTPSIRGCHSHGYPPMIYQSSVVATCCQPAHSAAQAFQPVGHIYQFDCYVATLICPWPCPNWSLVLRTGQSARNYN